MFLSIINILFKKFICSYNCCILKLEMYIVYSIFKYKCSYICCMFYVELIELIEIDYKILVVCMVLVFYIVD